MSVVSCQPALFPLGIAALCFIIPCRLHHLPSPRTIDTPSAIVHSSCRVLVAAHLQRLCRRSCHACPFLWSAKHSLFLLSRNFSQSHCSSFAHARPTAAHDRAALSTFTCCAVCRLRWGLWSGVCGWCCEIVLLSLSSQLAADDVATQKVGASSNDSGARRILSLIS